MARKFVRLASPIKKMVKGIGSIIGALVPVFDYVRYRTTPVGTVPTDQGTVSWNADELTLDLVQNGTILQFGQEMQFPPVRNNTGSILLNGVAAMATGTIGVSGRITISKMDASVSSNGKFFIGILTEDILNGVDGKATTFGKVRGIDTSSWNEGDVLYLDPAVLGGLTNVEPTYPDMSMAVAFVITKHATIGTIMVRVNNLDTNAFTAPADVLPRSAWNGTFVESFNCIPSSDGATITVSLEKEGGGDLTMQFSDGLTTLDCTPACTATLTAGSATVYQKNYIYIPIATKLLTVSTTGWPATEHIKVSFQCVFTAAVVQTEDAFIHQDWNDELSDPVGMGHITHIGQILREGQGWFSGVDGAGTTGYLTIGAGTATVQATAGVIKQVHTHTYTAKNTATGDDVHVVNDPTTPYVEITDLTNLTQDSTGGSLNNKYFNVVLAGTSNKSGQYSPLLLLLPSGTYNGSTNAERDIDGYTSTALPREFNKDSSNGFLIARLTLRLSGGNITLVATEDLRGVDSGSGGAGNAAVTEFPDSTFRIQNTADPTKEIDFDASGITTGTTRTITMPDRDVDLGSLIDYANPATLVASQELVIGKSYYLDTGSSGCTLPSAVGQTGKQIAGYIIADTDLPNPLIQLTGIYGLKTNYGFMTGERFLYESDGASWFMREAADIEMTATMLATGGDTYTNGVFRAPNYNVTDNDIGGIADLANDQFQMRRRNPVFLTNLATLTASGNYAGSDIFCSAVRDGAGVNATSGLAAVFDGSVSSFGTGLMTVCLLSTSSTNTFIIRMRTRWGVNTVSSSLGNGAPMTTIKEVITWNVPE